MTVEHRVSVVVEYSDSCVEISILLTVSLQCVTVSDEQVYELVETDVVVAELGEEIIDVLLAIED